MAEFFRSVVNHQHGDEDDLKESRQIRILLQGQNLAEFLAKPACANLADDGRGTHVNLESQESVANDVGHDLWHRPVANLIKPRSTCGLYTLQRAHIDVFIYFRVKLPQRPGRVKPDGQHPRHWAQ